MARINSIAVYIGSVALLPCVAFPQETPAVSAPPEFTFTVDKSQRMSPATGAPYSAHEVHEVQMPSGDGALIPQATTILHVYRDSQGRTRKDRPVPGSEFIIVEIQDPVARCEYVLDPQRRIAHRLKQPLFEIYDAHKAGAKTGALKPAAPGAVPDGYESLGTRMIEGVMAEGTRQTLNIPSSSRKHRHRGPFKANLEVWNSPELEVRVLTKSSDNRTRGDTVIRLTHISRSEPDPALFQVPTGYTVVDESDTFSIVITRP